MRLNGTVKFFNESKGFGFIIPEGDGKDIFFHRKDVKDERYIPREKDRVTYEEGSSNKGPCAKDVKSA